jgi:hypothetical protein
MAFQSYKIKEQETHKISGHKSELHACVNQHETGIKLCFNLSTLK